MKRTRLILIAILTFAIAAVAFAHHTEHNHPVTGTVKMLHENHLAINTSANKHLTVHLTDKTVLTKGTRADLKPGARVSIVLKDDGKTATSVEIAAAEKQQQAGNQADKAVPVASNMVCMINNRSMANEQIPVEIDGKTYYGCCPMCKERLEKDEASRYAVDPVSGKKVDKAKAVIGALPGAAVLYFENEENLRKYNAAAK